MREVFKKRRLAVWQYHGIFATGSDMDEDFGLIDTAEKAAEIYIKATEIGGVKNRISLAQIVSIAENFGKQVNEEILRAFVVNH